MVCGVAGRVTRAQKHVIPSGGWFEYVSCPHYLFEMVIYAGAFQLVGGMEHVTLWSVTGFVVCNQLVAAHVTHQWYRGEFKATYPKQRTAVIPRLF
jgi:3-oxo-5-alpha-steroid 4-dehydrogenase 3